jgi:hypothetical protein
MIAAVESRIVTMLMDATYEEVHQQLIAQGHLLRETSPSGSRYYSRLHGNDVRVSDHDPNCPTFDWMRANGVSDLRVKPRGTCPRPGIYPDVDFADYLRWQAISNSSLQPATKSMAHYLLQQSIEETPPMKLGTLCHAGQFEPLEVARRYVVMPAYEDKVRKPTGERYDKPKSSAAYKELVASFDEANRDKIVVTQSEYDDMLGVVKSLAKSPRAREYLTGGMSEVALVWIDPVTGMLCKGRVDHLQLDRRRASDLKTTADAAQAESLIAKRGYHRQMGFYCDGLKVLTGEEFNAAMVFGEFTGPVYGVRGAPFSATTLDAGRAEYRRLLDQIAKCREADVWPAYNEPDEWKLPAWATRADDEPVELVIGGQTVRL